MALVSTTTTGSKHNKWVLVCSLVLSFRTLHLVRISSRALSLASYSPPATPTGTNFDPLLKATHKALDIGVPVGGSQKSLILQKFSIGLGKAIADFQASTPQSIQIRLLVTRFGTNDTRDDQLLQDLATWTQLPRENVLVLPVAQTAFSRSIAINRLREATIPQAVLAVLDVDMHLEASFLQNALIHTHANRSIYFPIVFSPYRPSTVALMEWLLADPMSEKIWHEWELSQQVESNADQTNTTMANDPFHFHRGLWREKGYGMFTVSGTNAMEWAQMDEAYVGWGEEDKDMHRRVTLMTNATVVREREPGLVHQWHAKTCEVGTFVIKKLARRWYVLHNNVRTACFYLMTWINDD